MTVVASLVTYCSDRPATCTSARAVATVECTSSEQSPARDARAPFVTGNPRRDAQAQIAEPVELSDARGSQSRTRVNRATREESRPIPSNSSMSGPPITDEPLTLVRLLTLTLPKQVMLARLSLDGSKDPTLTSDQSSGAATLPIHPDRVTREPSTWREEQTQRTIGHRAIELERIGKHKRPRSRRRMRICQKPDYERAYALRHERETHEIRQIPIVERRHIPNDQAEDSLGQIAHGVHFEKRQVNPVLSTTLPM